MSELGPSILEQIEIEYSRTEKRRLFDQKPLPGLEDYVCTFDCLEHCPLAPDGGCYYWDTFPLENIEYPEFDSWQDLHEESVRSEPENPLQTRCPRCYSTKVTIGDTYIVCANCEYDEVLADYPASRN